MFFYIKIILKKQQQHGHCIIIYDIKINVSYHTITGSLEYENETLNITFHEK